MIKASFVQDLVCTVHVKLKDSKIAQYASLWEEAGLCASRTFFVSFCICCPFLSFSLRLAVVCNCGFPWTFLAHLSRMLIGELIV